MAISIRNTDSPAAGVADLILIDGELWRVPAAEVALLRPAGLR